MNNKTPFMVKPIDSGNIDNNLMISSDNVEIPLSTFIMYCYQKDLTPFLECDDKLIINADTFMKITSAEKMKKPKHNVQYISFTIAGIVIGIILGLIF